VPLGATTLALIATDRRTASELDDDDDFRLDVSRGVSALGGIYTTGGIAATFYIVGRRIGNARARETGLLSMEALANGAAVYGVLKRVSQRPRPRQENGHARFFDEGNAFPSGHAVNAWSVATVIAYEYADRETLP
jgi:membrane-associated phospholipid phosphatase